MNQKKELYNTIFIEENSLKFIIILLIISLYSYYHYDIWMQENNNDNLFHNAYALESSQGKSKMMFTGQEHMTIYGDYKLDFKVDPRTNDPFVADAKFQIGNTKLDMFGGGYMKQFYLYGDKQCKRILGFEYITDLSGNSVRLDFNGKICYMGSQIRLVNLNFIGRLGQGIFENAEISGTLSGSSGFAELNYDLFVKSILVYNN